MSIAAAYDVSKISSEESSSRNEVVHHDGNRSLAYEPQATSLHEHKAQRRYEYFCLGSLCFSTFLSGWGDASNGPLIPTMQSHYNVRSYPHCFVVPSIDAA